MHKTHSDSPALSHRVTPNSVVDSVAQRSKHRFHITLAMLAMASLFSACSSAPVLPPQALAPAVPVVTAPVVVAAPAVKPDAAPPVAVPSGAGQSVAATTVATVVLPPHLDPKSAVASERSVFFAFDDYSIADEYTRMLERHAKYLAGKPALPIKIEGHADERGSAEYNLALGQQRAEAVLRALKIYGAKDSQVEAISWGEERPRALGQTESVWSQNRRADVSYPKQ